MSSRPAPLSSPSDPLEALRSADARPFEERWRDALRARSETIPSRIRTATLIAAALVVVAVVARSQLVTADPPIEDSLPVAVERSPVSVALTGSTAEAGAEALAPASGDVVVVHVAGAVARPGLVEGRSGWRVDDAIDAAGGAQAAADLDRINLAAPLVDGERIYVPRVGEAAIPPVSRGSTPATDSGPIDLNSSDSVALQSLPGVGPATAAAIVAHREENGPFGSVDALVAVRGIGPATLDSLRDHVTVG